MMIKTGKRRIFAVVFAALMIAAAFLAVTDAAFASTSGSSGSSTPMPWEEGLDKLQASITGPVAMAISLIAIIAAGAALIFGGDMTGFMRTTVYIVLVLGIIISASGLLKALFSGTSAFITI